MVQTKQVSPKVVQNDLKEILDTTKWSARRLSKEIGTTESTLHKHLKGLAQRPSEELYDKIRDVKKRVLEPVQKKVVAERTIKPAKTEKVSSTPQLTMTQTSTYLVKTTAYYEVTFDEDMEMISSTEYKITLSNPHDQKMVGTHNVVSIILTHTSRF